MMTTLCTIGYEGAALTDFVATLKASGVQRVVDVRELPQSRRPGFSKNAVRLALADASIGYEHRRELGDPKPGRDAARAGDMKLFRRIFMAHVASPAARESIGTLVELIHEERCALLCYERNPQDCHRKLLCDELSQLTSVEIRHLGVQPGRAPGRTADGASQHAGAC